jgi:hypothetical protein
MQETDWKETAENVARKLRRAEALLRLCYRKHHMDDPSIGSNELSDALCNTLCEFMGDSEFQEWSHDPESRDDRTPAFF